MTWSPAFAPSSDRPSGESGETPPTLEISTSMRSPCSSSSSTSTRSRRPVAGGLLVNDDGAAQAVPQHRDAALEEALLVLGGVVLEVLREVAEAARGLDRLDDRDPPWALQLGQLGLELLLLGRGQRSAFSVAIGGG